MLIPGNWSCWGWEAFFTCAITQLMCAITQLIRAITQLIRAITQLIWAITQLIWAITQLMCAITKLPNVCNHSINVCNHSINMSNHSINIGNHYIQSLGYAAGTTTAWIQELNLTQHSILEKNGCTQYTGEQQKKDQIKIDHIWIKIGK